MNRENLGSVETVTAEPKRASWNEVFEGGTPAAEHAAFLELAQDMVKVQEVHRQRAGSPHPARTLHAKIVAGFTDALLRVDDVIAPEFAAGHIQRGATLPAIIRFSNASGVSQSDCAPDMRGIALRLITPSGEPHDLLMTSFPVSHARDARQFVMFAVAAASGPPGGLLERLDACLGASEARRMLATISAGMRPSRSLALERFWSRGAVLWNGMPVRFSLRPAPGVLPPLASPTNDPDALRTELVERLTTADLRFRLTLQRFVNEKWTPIEDGSVEWLEHVSPPVEMATLVVPKWSPDASPIQDQTAQVNALSFNPWNAPAAFRPLGHLNRARAIVYGKSAARWQGTINQ
jgi:hypothetical protein